LEGLIPNCGLHEIKSDVRGREVAVPPIRRTGKILSIREGSFNIHGPWLFNSLPTEIRNLTKINVDELKTKLDKYLEKHC